MYQDRLPDIRCQTRDPICRSVVRTSVEAFKGVESTHLISTYNP